MNRDWERANLLLSRQVCDAAANAQQASADASGAVSALATATNITDKKGKKTSLQCVADALSDLADALATLTERVTVLEKDKGVKG
jgi:hypothetical protein